MFSYIGGIYFCGCFAVISMGVDTYLPLAQVRHNQFLQKYFLNSKFNFEKK